MTLALGLPKEITNLRAYQKGGYVKFKQVAATVALTGTLLAGVGVAAAAADVQYPVEGGTWSYGFWDAHARSYYTHNTRCHGSTASNDWGTNRSINTYAGRQSIAEQFGTVFTNNRYYYRVC